jgi:hypothetical protein
MQINSSSLGFQLNIAKILYMIAGLACDDWIICRGLALV